MTTHQAEEARRAPACSPSATASTLPLTRRPGTQALAFYKPADDSAEMRYLHAPRAGARRLRCRRGAATARRCRCPRSTAYAAFALQADGKEMSTTMAFVRMLGNLLKDPALGPRVVPIVADEARTFGMANLFKQVGIYSPRRPALPARGHRLGAVVPRGTGRPDPRRRHQRGRRARQSWTAAATQLLVHGLRDAAVLHLLLDVRLPARRRPDLGRRRPARARLPARRDRRAARRSAAKACSTRTASSHLVAATMPNCKAYDPAFAGEMAVIVDRGMREMLVEQQDVFYYVTADERELRPADAAGRGARAACCAAATASRARRAPTARAQVHAARRRARSWPR